MCYAKYIKLINLYTHTDTTSGCEETSVSLSDDLHENGPYLTKQINNVY